MSSTPKNKSELIHAIQDAQAKLMADYNNIPEQHARTMGVEGNVKGTQISVCDTLAYLLGWEQLVLKWHALKSNNQNVDFPETGYQWNELGRLAQRFYQDYADWSFERLKEEWASTNDQILDLIQGLSNQALYGKPWYKNHTLGRMIQFNTSSPMKNVRTKVRRFIKQADF